MSLSLSHSPCSIHHNHQHKQTKQTNKTNQIKSKQFKQIKTLQFADKEMKPYAAQWDADAEFPMETFKKFGELGFGGIFVKEDVGGSALTRYVCELLTYFCMCICK